RRRVRNAWRSYQLSAFRCLAKCDYSERSGLLTCDCGRSSEEQSFSRFTVSHGVEATPRGLACDMRDTRLRIAARVRRLPDGSLLCRSRCQMQSEHTKRQGPYLCSKQAFRKGAQDIQGDG